VIKARRTKFPPRHQARELVLKSLYAIESGSVEPDESLKKLATDISISKKHKQFAQQLFSITRDNAKWADEQISKFAKNWKIERINIIDKNIIRMAMVEIRHFPDVPVKVVINEAIELAKTFSTEESASFVNGILDAFSKSIVG
jgi:N utilization substance protein B